MTSCSSRPPAAQLIRSVASVGARTGWSLGAGTYVVTGTAHIQPGTTLDPYLLRRQVRFLPPDRRMGHGP